MSAILTATGGRNLTYLRLSVTDRCNLRCRYCMPPEGVPKLAHKDILSYEEFLRLARLGSSLGLRKLRLTGGEPLVRRGVVDFIKRLSREKLFQELRLTTNGLMLSEMAADLKAAGIKGLNISLDSLAPAVYAEMVGFPGRAGEELAGRAWAGFQAALAAGFNTKINCVPIRGVNDGQVTALARLALDYPVEVRFIEHMPIGRGDLWRRSSYLPTEELLAMVAKDLGPLEPLLPSDPSAPSRLYRARGALGAIGFISPLSGHFCGRCNRLRLTADGKLKPCLLTEREIDLRTPLRAGAADQELLALFLDAAGHKPISHLEARAEGLAPCYGREMSRIGG